MKGRLRNKLAGLPWRPPGWLRTAWASSLLFIVVGGAAFLVIGLATSGMDPLVKASRADPGVTPRGAPIRANPVTDSTAWLAWKFAVSLGVALALFLLAAGVRQLDGLRKRHEVPREVVLGHVLLALALYGATFWFLFVAAAAGRDWPIPNMRGTLAAISLISALGAVPWLAAVWLTHRVLQHQVLPSQDESRHPIGKHAAARLGELRESDAAPLHAELRDRRIADYELARLTGLWDVIEACTRAFAVFVVIALVPTGALRLAWLAQGVQPTGAVRLEYQFCPAPQGAKRALEKACEALPAEFPTLQVLLYGAFFAVLLVAVALPLLASWRVQARAAVDDAAPQGTIAQLEDPALRDRRARLETALRLDSGLLREPVSAIAILTPLVSSIVAALLPELSA